MKRYLGSETLLTWMKSAIPTLDTNKYKGQAGKICVIGGSKEYTGAPYFSAISALLCGADLVHIICPPDAASVIKSYSPELIVHPILGTDTKQCCQCLDQMHAVVLGPGLGRDNGIITESLELIKHLRAKNIPMVIDADGISVVCTDPSVITGYKGVVLTPNINEARRLYNRVVLDGSIFNLDIQCCSQIARVLGNVTIVAKGSTDIITDGVKDATCNIQGSLRRCGGQGDLLCGTMGLLLAWCYRSNVFSEVNGNLECETMTAAYNACSLTRKCAHLAFLENGRATTTSAMINLIGKSFEDIFST